MQNFKSHNSNNLKNNSKKYNQYNQVFDNTELDYSDIQRYGIKGVYSAVDYHPQSSKLIHDLICKDLKIVPDNGLDAEQKDPGCKFHTTILYHQFKSESPKEKETWSKRSIDTMLSNEKYTGRVILLKNNNSAPSYEFKEHHEAIISPMEFDKAQEIRENRIKGKAGGSFAPGIHVRLTQQYTFSCMLECGFCGATLSRRVWHSGTTHQKVMWHCVTATKRGKKHCPHSKGIAERSIEGAFVQSFQLLVQKNKGIVEELLERIKLSIEQDKKDDRPVTLQKQIKKLDAKINKLLDLRLEGGIAPEIYEEKYGALYKELEKVRSEYDQLTLQSDRQQDVQKRHPRGKRLYTGKW